MHNYAIKNGCVCVTSNGRWVNAEDLYCRLVKKYGEDSARKPGGACFTVLLDTEDVHAVLTPEELADAPLVSVPDERLEAEDWNRVPQWAKCYIVDMERLLDVQHGGMGDWD